MTEKIIGYIRSLMGRASQLQDMRLIGLVGFGVVALLITWSGIKVIDTNYKLQREMALLEQQNAVSELENQNLALQNEFYDSNEYMDMEARRNFGLAGPGETVYVVPKAAALSRLAAQPDDSTEAGMDESVSNISAWLSFLLRGEIR